MLKFRDVFLGNNVTLYGRNGSFKVVRANEYAHTFDVIQLESIKFGILFLDDLPESIKVETITPEAMSKIIN